MKKVILLVVSLFLIFSLMLTGCGLLQPRSNSISSTPSSVAGNGVFNLSDVDPITLDPAVASELQSAQYIMQIFSGLLRLDENLQPVGDIASTWEISPDGLKYTFHLRQEVKFHNGRALTAADFKYSWERAANPATRSLTAATYLGDIVGVKEMLGGKSTTASGVKVIDNNTLEVTIDSPKSYFLSKLTYPTSFVTDKDNVSGGSNWWRKPNGTGPFKFNQWVENTSLTLDRNSLYYGTMPQLGQVKYQFYSGSPMDLYETGKIDSTGVSLSYIDLVTDRSGPFYQELSTTPELSLAYIGFNCNKPPFDDVNIRRAFSLAIDKDKIVSLVYRNMVQKPNGILPPGMPGYNQNLSGLGFDLNMAKELIKASRYGDVSKLPPVIITTSGYGGAVGSTLQALAYQWKENLGVDVQIRQLEPERYIYNLKAEVDQMFDMGWVADYPHPQDFLDILFRSGGDNNYGSYSNPDVDSLIQQANLTSNKEQSFLLYQQAEKKIVDDAACIPLSFGKSYTLIRPYVKGYKISPVGVTILDSVSIAPH